VLVLTEAHPGHDEVSQPLAARWARAAAFGVPRDGDAYPVGPGDAELTERRARFDDVLRDRRPLLDPLARHLAASACCAIVADPDGIILSAHCGPGFDNPAARVRLVPGADWSEGARGTNAIGTAIAERAPIAVIGKAHYERRNGALFCYASPVFDAAGELAVVIDVSGAIEHDDASLSRSVREAAAAVERALRVMAYARAGFPNLALLERLVTGASAPTLLVEPRGPVRLHNEAARQSLMRGHDRVDCRTLFGADFAVLAEMAREGRDARFETRDEAFRVHLDPVVDPQQRTLGIVVHLEPLARNALRPSEAPPAKATASSLPHAFDAIHATDERVVAAKRLAATFAPTSIPVLLLAETGTGKELFARAIHAASAFARNPCVAINCGAVSASLLESELFGYAPGAFTGASRSGSVGLLGEADGGTLFLDEIAEMPEPLQAALLRALEDGTYRRLGDPRPRRSTFRLVAATCRNLAERVEQGTFRSDLLYRIHGACVRIPALRDRTDRVGLAEALLLQQRDPPPALAPSAIRHIDAHTWPGNVRELKSAVTHALALCGDGPIERDHFPEPLVGGVREDGRTRREVLREAASETLRATGGNVSEAARRLGVARDTLYRMLRRG
jgi:transcriptional regulator of acetoin/glycerol metabolism